MTKPKDYSKRSFDVFMEERFGRHWALVGTTEASFSYTKRIISQKEFDLAVKVFNMWSSKQKHVDMKRNRI